MGFTTSSNELESDLTPVKSTSACERIHPGLYPGKDFFTCTGTFYGGKVSIIRYERYDEGDTEHQHYSAPQYGYEASPRIWLGYTGCHGFGLRTRWWSLDQNSEVLESNLDEHDFTTTSVVFSTLELEVIDMEMTFRNHFCQ